MSALCRYVGPAQQRYGAYFSQILFSPSLRSPSEAAKSLRRIVFSPFDFVTVAAADPAIDGQWPDEDPQPFMVVYQHGRSVWAGPPDAQVGCVTPAWGCMLRFGSPAQQARWASGVSVCLMGFAAVVAYLYRIACCPFTLAWP